MFADIHPEQDEKRYNERLTLIQRGKLAPNSSSSAALASPAVARQLGDREPKRVIIVPGRLVNIVG